MRRGRVPRGLGEVVVKEAKKTEMGMEMKGENGNEGGMLQKVGL